MAKGGAGFINFHEKRKQYWAEYTWKDHIQFSTACCKKTLEPESMLLHGKYADRYAAAYDEMIEIQQADHDHRKCHTKDINILEAEELEARELIINTWDMEAALHAWHAEDMFETVGLRPLGDDMVDEIRDTVAKVVEAYPGNRQKEWLRWKSRFEEVCSMEDGRSRRIKQWALLKATPGTEDEPGLWQSWLSEFRFKTRLRMKLGRTRELYRDSVHLLASQILTFVGDGKWDTPECERLRLFLCRSIQDLSDIEFRQRLRTNTAPPGFSDSDYMELEKSYKKLKKIPSLIEKLSGISLLHSFLDGCLDDVPWDRICEGYVWHWIEFIMKLKPDVYVLGFSVVSNISLEALGRFTTGFELFQGTYLQELMDACRPQLDGSPTTNNMPVDAAANLAPQADGKRKGKKKRKQTKEALGKTKVESLAESQAEDMLAAAPELASDPNSGLLETAGDRQSDRRLALQSGQQQITTKDNTLVPGNTDKVGGCMKAEEILPALGPIEGREIKEHGETPELPDSCPTLGQLKSSDSYLSSSPPPFTHGNPVIDCYQELKEFELCREDKTVRSCQIIPLLVHQSTLVPRRETGSNMSGVARRLCNTELETVASERGEYGVINEPVLYDSLPPQQYLEERNGTTQYGENAEPKQAEEVVVMPAESDVAPELTAVGSAGQLEQSGALLALEVPTNDVNPRKALQLSYSGRNAMEEFDPDQESLLSQDGYWASTRGKKPASELKKIKESGLSDTTVGAILAESEKIICGEEDLKDDNTSSRMGQAIIRSNVISSKDRHGRVTTPTTSTDLTSHRISGKQTKVTSKADQEQKNAFPSESAGHLGPTNSSIDLPKSVESTSDNVSNLLIEIAKDELIMENGGVAAEGSMHSAQLSGTENGSWSIVKEKPKGKKKASVATKLPEEPPACEEKKRSSHAFLPSSSVQPQIGRGRLKNDPDQTAINVVNGSKPVQPCSEPTPTRGLIPGALAVNLIPTRAVEPPVRSNSQHKRREKSIALSANRAAPVIPTKKHQDEQTASEKAHVVEHKAANKPINRPPDSHHRTRPLSLPGSSCVVRMVGDENKSSSRGRTIWSDSHVALKSLFGGGAEDPVLPQEEGLSNKPSSTCQQAMPPAVPKSMDSINPAITPLAKLAVLGTGKDGTDTPTPYSLILKSSSAQRVSFKERRQTILQQDTEQPGTLEAIAPTKVTIRIEGKEPTKSPELMGVNSGNDERTSFQGAKTTLTNGRYSRTKLVYNNDFLHGDRHNMGEENMLGEYKRLAQEDIAALSAENNKLRDLILKLIDDRADEGNAAMIASYRAIESVKLQSCPSQDREKLCQHRRKKDRPLDKRSLFTLDGLTVAEGEKPKNGPTLLSLPKDETKPSPERPEAYSIQFQSRRIPKFKDKRKGRNTREIQPKITHILRREEHISSNIEANLLPGVKAQPAGGLSYRSSKKTGRHKTPIPNTATHPDPGSGDSAPGLNAPPRSIEENQSGEMLPLMAGPDGQPIYTSGHFRRPLVVPGLRFESFSASVSSRAPLSQPHS